METLGADFSRQIYRAAAVLGVRLWFFVIVYMCTSIPRLNAGSSEVARPNGQHVRNHHSAHTSAPFRKRFVSY